MRGPRPFLLFAVLLGLAVAPPAAANGPILHVPIPTDIEDDWSLGATGAGDIPAAVETRNGLVRAPDARKPPAPNDPAYENAGAGDSGGDRSVFTPDRNTRRPDVSHYDEPFRPATAPFKRLWVYDAVDESYRLYVRQTRQEPIHTDSAPSKGVNPGGGSPSAGSPSAASDTPEERFFADIVINARADAAVRIPSVAPGARVVRAHLAAGQRDLSFSLFRDGADNWFVAAPPGRSRLVMEVAAPRDAFGGDFGAASWGELPPVEKLPAKIAAAAKLVTARIGVSRQQQPVLGPREMVRKLVSYHRSFVEAEDPPREHNDVYLDLALSQKGVCRHRAFSFFVTALSLGLPTRMVMNEAHAWVEVHDGRLWRRIDLGGAGRTVGDPVREAPAYDAPPDPFQWPTGATPGESLLGGAPAASSSGNRRGNAPGTSGSQAGGRTATGVDDGSSDGKGATSSQMSSNDPSRPAADEKDDRPRSQVAIAVGSLDTRRGGPLRVNGRVQSDGEACPNVVVDVVLREAGKGARAAELRVGSLATDARGAYEGALVVPSNVPIGDYDVVGRTAGNMRCGRGP